MTTWDITLQFSWNTGLHHVLRNTCVPWNSRLPSWNNEAVT